MKRFWALLPVAALSGLLPLPTAGAQRASPDYLALNPRGVAHNESSDPTHVVYTVDVYSLANGSRVGTLTDDITCSSSAAPCLVLDIVSTFRLSGGDITSHARWSGIPDPQRPGSLLAATRATQDTIASGTGQFAGRTGRVNGWGTVDARKFPGELAYDMFPVVHFGAADSEVLGSSDLLAGPTPVVPPAGPVTQYFTSRGVNESSDPTHFVATTDLYSLASAQRIGTAVDSVTCATSAPPPCAVLDVLTVFRYPEGEMTARSRISIVPDPQRPGFALVGTRPETDTVTEGTGAFAGRTGRLLLSGSVDMRNFPKVAPFEGVSVITFN